MIKKYRGKAVSMVFILSSFSVFPDGEIPQSSPVPIDLDRAGKRDNIVYLMAASSNHNPRMLVTDYGSPKHTWINNFSDKGDYLRWSVRLEKDADYHVWALLNSGTAIPMRLAVEGADSDINISTRNIGWDKLDMGNIHIPAGNSTLKLTRDTAVSGNIEIKSLELIRKSDLLDYDRRVKEFKKDTNWFSRSGYGLMFQYGPWGYPQRGVRKSIHQGAADFDVEKFINMVKGTGAGYIIWSMTWWEYRVQAPVKSIDSIIGDGDHTTSRDLIGEIAKKCNENRIKFFLYYHTGIQQDAKWATKQQWPESFTPRGSGDRSLFFDNWVSVITEIGNRYGRNLSGWFFDDGMTYYPAPFERLGSAARVGNPDRLISYNSWVSARVTEFQDVYFGEGSHGEPQFGSAPAGGNGLFLDGHQKGLLQQAMFTMEQDWGVHEANAPINTGVSVKQAVAWVSSAISRNVPLSFNLMMWEDGSVSADSLDVLNGVKKHIAAMKFYKNDAGGEIKYVGNWNYSSNRGVGDYMEDVHYTTEDNSYFEYSFNGTGIDYITEKNNDMGEVDIFVDGIFKETVNCYNSSRIGMSTLFSIRGLPFGPHKIVGKKRSGTYMLLDVLFVREER